MQTVTFECEIITPMFMAGADGQTPELRPPSIKGALRFWWRAMHGHLSLEELKRKEDNIFGGGGESASKSSFKIMCTHPRLNNAKQVMVNRNGGKGPTEQHAFNENQSFEVRFILTDVKEGFTIQHLTALFELTCWLGGLGKRGRRGRGGIQIKQPDRQLLIPTVEEICQRINLFAPYYAVNGSMLVNNFQGRTPDYPVLQRVEIGRPAQDLLEKIDRTAHNLLKKHGINYEASLGKAKGGRFASPIYTSVCKNERNQLVPIISTLKTEPDPRDKSLVRGSVQDEFKKSIL